MIDHHEFTLHLIESSYELKQLDELNFYRLIGKLLDTESEDLGKLITLNKELINALADNEIQKISDRLIAGSAKIEIEKDPVKKRQYLAVYDQLLKKMNEIIDSKSA